ncbi:hypothetical protein D3C77_221780 [compost metagenome]
MGLHRGAVGLIDVLNASIEGCRRIAAFVALTAIGRRFVFQTLGKVGNRRTGVVGNRDLKCRLAGMFKGIGNDQRDKLPGIEDAFILERQTFLVGASAGEYPSQ